MPIIFKQSWKNRGISIARGKKKKKNKTKSILETGFQCEILQRLKQNKSSGQASRENNNIRCFWLTGNSARIR